MVEDYLERNQEDFDEFVEPEDMYADLDLDELEELAARNKASKNIAAELRSPPKPTAASPPRTLRSRRQTVECETAGATFRKDEDGAKEAATHRDGGAKAPKGHEAPASAKKPIPAPVGKAGVLGGVSGGLPAPLGLPRDGGGGGGGGKEHPRAQGGERRSTPREGALGGERWILGRARRRRCGRPGSRIRAAAAAELVVPRPAAAATARVDGTHERRGLSDGTRSWTGTRVRGDFSDAARARLEQIPAPPPGGRGAAPRFNWVPRARAAERVAARA